MEEETEPSKFGRLVQCMVRHTALPTSSEVDDKPCREGLAAVVGNEAARLFPDLAE
jgi:hypothetical protein